LGIYLHFVKEARLRWSPSFFQFHLGFFETVYSLISSPGIVSQNAQGTPF
jgi:hypothetical protein